MGFIALDAKARGDFFARQNEMRSCGVTFWLDDFLPEYSAQLDPCIPYFDEVKIDKSVLWKYPSAPEGFTEFVNHLSLMTDQIIVEGGQNAAQLEMANETGCSLLQGFYWPEERLNLNYVPV